MRKQSTLLMLLCGVLLLNSLTSLSQGVTDITDLGGQISAQYNDSPSGEDINKLIDNSVTTKYLTFHNTCWVQFRANTSAIITKYSITSANDVPERDPKDWNLQGSNDGNSWFTLDSRYGQAFSSRGQKKEYSFSNSNSYTFYRLNISANNGANIIQLSELELWTSGGTPTGVATVYQHTNYGGYAIGLNVGYYTQSSLAGLGISNNDLSSIKVTNGYKITMYDGDNFTGESLVKTADDATLVDDGWNDRATSIKVEQVGSNAVATVYQHTNYGGYAVGLSVGNYSLSALQSLGISDNDLSSIKVTSGYKITLYDSDNFSGASLVKTSDDATLVDDGWNDRATSIKVALNNNSGDWSSFIYPTVTVKNNAGSHQGVTLYTQLCQANGYSGIEDFVKANCLLIAKTIYYTVEEANAHNLRKITYELSDGGPLSWKGGSPPEISVGFDVNYIVSFVNQHGSAAAIDEVRGVLCHELTHGYQKEPKNAGEYDGNSEFYGYIEGMADLGRLMTGGFNPVRYPSPGGNWKNGYTTTAFFYRWLKDNKAPVAENFIKDLNLTAQNMATWSHQAMCQQLFGRSVQSLWDEYQNSLTQSLNKSASNTVSNTLIKNDLSIEEELEFKIWPNPFSSTIHLSIPDFKESAEVTIFSITGAKVFSKTVTSAISDIDVNQLPGGNYIISVESGNKVNKKKLVK